MLWKIQRQVKQKTINELKIIKVPCGTFFYVNKGGRNMELIKNGTI
jgi:hypothetical protein